MAQEGQYEDSGDRAQRFLFITLTGIPPTGFAVAILTFVSPLSVQRRPQAYLHPVVGNPRI